MKTEALWLEEIISKLEKRLEVQRSLSLSCDHDPVRRQANDQVVTKMGSALFKLQQEKRSLTKSMTR